MTEENAQKTQFLSRVCVSCQKRKVKCSGRLPCARCVRDRREASCCFLDSAARATSAAPAKPLNSVQGNGACSICHAQKIRCDHARPCSRCVRNHRASECVDRVPKRRRIEAGNELSTIQSSSASKSRVGETWSILLPMLLAPTRGTSCYRSFLVISGSADVNSLVRKTFAEGSTFDRSVALSWST